jgi:hypothetical protein
MKITVARRNAQLDNLCAALNSGYLRIYSGTKPADADTGLSGNTLLAELTFGSTAFGAASGGVATANAITQDSAANATGTATFARLFASNGSTAITDITVGASGAELNLSTVSIVQDVIVQVTSLTITQPDGT